MDREKFFVIETGAYEDGNPHRLLEALRARGLKHRAVEFSDGADPKLAPTDDAVIAYASLGMVRGMLNQHRWSPVAWLDPAALACHAYYPTLANLLLQKHHTFVTWGELPARFPDLVSQIGQEDAVFIRPDNCWKTFAGRLLRTADFPRWYKQNSSCYDIPPHTCCVAASPQTVLREWRCIIAGDSVITSSAYIAENRQAADASAPQPVLDLATRAAQRHPFPTMPIFTLDIGETPEGLFLLEPGSVNASSLYHCDINAVLDAMLST